MKSCCTCKVIKDIESFGKLKSSKDGYRHDCKDCRKLYSIKNKNLNKEYKKNYYNKNKIEVLSKNKKWIEDNSEIIMEYNKNYYNKNKDRKSSYHKKWRVENKDKIREYKKYYYHNITVNDPFKIIKITARSIVRRFLKKKTLNTANIIGCSYEFLKEYIESKFEPWMTWENYGKYNGELNYGWDIDHIIPLSSAKTDEDVMKLNHYSNLQPLCSYTNRNIKINKINGIY